MGRRLGVLIVFLMLLSCFWEASAQYFIWGQDPGSLRWRQIVTPHFRVIFPEDYAEQAAYIADVLEYTYEPGSKTLGHSPRRVPVILHNHTVAANGFVSWAPARLEMFSNPPQNNDGHDWLESLAVHEFRHVVQVDKLNQGITRVLSYLLGQQATGIVLGLFVPIWFLEGDAVAVETGLTHGGRGRLPAFEQGLRAQVLEQGIPSFEKASLGSLKEHVPNHYELGYQLVAHARALYGADIWDKVIDNVGRRPHTLFPFSHGLKRYAGVNKKQLYEQTMHHLDSVWNRQLSQHTYTLAEAVNQAKPLYANYRYPVFLNDSAWLVLKHALDDIPRVVVVEADGREQVLFTPGLLNAHPISSNGNRVVWSEHRRDPRWEHRSWSEIHLYDLATAKKKRLTRKTRYFSPALSPDGSQVAVAAVSSSNAYSIVVIDAESGEPLQQYATPDNDFLMTPSWHIDNRTLVAVALGEDGKRIVVTDEGDAGLTTVYHAGRTEISRPRFFSGSGILFNGAFSGIDNVYALDMDSGKVRQVVSSPLGAVDADLSPDGLTMVWSGYSSMGYDINRGIFDLSGSIEMEAVTDHSHRLDSLLAAQEGEVVTRSRIPRKEYLDVPYYKTSGLLNIHSWGPFSVDADNMTASPGISVMSQNPLSTSVAALGYDYDLMEQRGRFFADIRYMGFYPELNLRFERGLRSSVYNDNQGNRVPFEWRENTMRLGATVPLSFQRGAWFMGLQPSLHAGVTRVLRTSDTPSFFRRNDITSMDYRLLAYGQHRMVARDLRPRWGLVADMNYRHTPFAGGDMGSVLAARTVVFVPGMLKHHSLRLSASWQKKQQGVSRPQTINYSYGSQVMYPRGIDGRNDDVATNFSVDYALPLFYPDWQLGSVLYMKRLSINGFYDHAQVRYTVVQAEKQAEQRDETLYSYGADLMTRVHFLRAFAPFDIGLRVMFPNTHDKAQFQFLWSVSIM